MSDEERECTLEEQYGLEEDEERGEENRIKKGSKEEDEHLTKHFPGFLNAIKMCVKETDIKSIDVGNLNLETVHLKSIFSLLPNTKVTELNVENNDLRRGIPEFTKQLIKSPVKKLNLKNCELLVMDVLALMQSLPQTQVIDLDLSCLAFTALYCKKSARAFVAPLRKSRLTHLRLTASSLLGQSSGKSALGKYLASHLSLTFITHLWLEKTGLCQDAEALKDLFTNLPSTKVTELYLGYNGIEDEQLKPLCENLKQSKLEVLDLCSNKLTDAGMNLLSEAIVGSKVRKLAVATNNISGANDFGKHLKDTAITELHLGGNKIENCQMFSAPNFLEDTSVTELHLDSCDLGDEFAQKIVKCLRSTMVSKIVLSRNNLGLLTATEFASILKETKITEVDFSENNFSAEALSVIGKNIKDSDLKCFTLRGESNKFQEGLPVAAFIDKIKGSALESLDISFTGLEDKIASIMAFLQNATLMQLNLSSCQIGTRIIDLAPVLKHSTLTRLNLSRNDVDDVGAETLAEFLNKTKIVKLDVSHNAISDQGAKALVLCLKRGPLYQLDLGHNKITDEGIEELAKIIEGTYIINLEVDYNSGRKTLNLKTVVWRNLLLVQKLVRFFNTIFPSAGSGAVFQCNYKTDDAHFDAFVEKCLLLYKAALKEPSAISALANDDSVSFSREEVAKLVEEFPSRFSSFINSKTKIKAGQLVKFLEKAKFLDLSTIVEFFLGKLAVLIIGLKKGVLLPPTYELLGKHKEAICNLELKPEEKKKVMKYFTAPPVCCGLCGKTKELIKVECCKNWICNDERKKYVLGTFARTSCIRNHRKYTLCSLHYNNKHKGKWQDCQKCKKEYLIENYVDYATNDYNFEKLQNAPKITITCYSCGFQSQTLKDFGCQTSGGLFFCGDKKCQDKASFSGIPAPGLGIPMITPLYKYSQFTPQLQVPTNSLGSLFSSLSQFSF